MRRAGFSRFLRGSFLLGLLAAAAIGAGLGPAACARPGAPPGGPPDRLPPLVVSTEPDTFATLDGGLSRVRFRFSERISERPSSGTLAGAVRVSPATGPVRVEHDRQALEVTLQGGFRPGLVYRVTVQPVIQDLFNNVMPDAFELIFSTGGDFHRNLVAGRVVDRITGEPVEGVQVRASVPGDSLTYVAGADSAGIFALRYLPPDQYRLEVFQDLNRNDSVDFSEAQASRRVALATADTVLIERIALLRPDTTPAVLASADVRDSISLTLAFDDYLDPQVPLDDVRAELTRQVSDTVAPDSVVMQEEGPGPPVEGVYYPWVLDSIFRARADSAAMAEGEEAPPEEQEEEAEAPAERLPGQEARVLLAAPLEPGATYRLEVSGVRNIYGAAGGGGSATIQAPRPEEPDTAGAAQDTVAAPADTSALPPDTAGATPPDTTGAGRDEAFRWSPPDLRRYRQSPFRSSAGRILAVRNDA